MLISYFIMVMIIPSEITPFLTVIISLWIGSSGNKYREEKLIQSGYELQTKVDAYNPAGALAVYANVKNMVKEETKNKSSISDVETLEKYYDLKEKGAITEQEFEKKKKEILG